MLDVRIWPTRRGLTQTQSSGLFAFAQVRNSAYLRVHLNAASPAAFRLIEYDQVAE